MKEANVKFEYENGSFDFTINKGEIPLTMLYQAVCLLKDSIEMHIASEPVDMGLSEEAVKEYIDARFETERQILDL